MWTKVLLHSLNVALVEITDTWQERYSRSWGRITLALRDGKREFPFFFFFLRTWTIPIDIYSVSRWPVSHCAFVHLLCLACWWRHTYLFSGKSLIAKFAFCRIDARAALLWRKRTFRWNYLRSCNLRRQTSKKRRLCEEVKYSVNATNRNSTFPWAEWTGIFFPLLGERNKNDYFTICM